MKKLFFLSLILMFSQPEIFSQDGFRIKLIKNMNLHNAGNYSALWGYTAPNGREYAILGCYNGTSFVDITDSNTVREIAYLLSPMGSVSIWREMKTYSHYCYIVSEAGGSKIQIVDLQYLPDSIRYIGLSNIPDHSTTHTISQSGHYLYLNGGNSSFCSGVGVIDIINPEVPVLRGKWQDLYVHDSRIINDTIWACNISNGKVSIIDANNKDSLKNVNSWVNNPPPNTPHNIALSGDHRYVFVTNETTGGTLKIYNVSDRSNIIYINAFNAYPFENAIVHNVEVYNNFAFLAYYDAGVKVLNISNPEAPVEIGWFDTHPEDNSGGYQGCWAVYYFPSGKIIASDETKGLFVLKPDLTNQIAGQPKVNFTKERSVVGRLSTIRLIDMTEGLPAKWNWTIEGPETQSSNMKNPDLTFIDTGYYSVKLKASNSFGTDSVIKSDFFRVINAALPGFPVVNPAGTPPIRILVSSTDTGTVFFNWQKPANHPILRYKLFFKKLLGTSQYIFSSGNDGIDTFYFARKSFLDSMALQFGLDGDSVRVSFKAIAYAGQDSVLSYNLISLILRRANTLIQTLNESVPSEFKLHNNYPNPFNPVTRIKFDIPPDLTNERQDIKLIIYDVLGKEIVTLVNEKLSAGNYEIDWDASNNPSGIYFYRLLAKDFVETKKMVLVR